MRFAGAVLCLAVFACSSSPEEAIDAPVDIADDLGADVAEPQADVPVEDTADPALAVDEGPASPDLGPSTFDEGVLHTGLTINLSTLKGTATLRAVRSSAGTWRTDGLEVSSVTVDGSEAEWSVADGVLTVAVGDSPDPAVIVVEYTFSLVAKGSFMGAMESGSTLLWPEYCSNLFPCQPHPADGSTFSLEVLGAPEGQIAVYPAEIAADVPPYTVAWAVGDYTWTPIGTTTQGTDVGFWATPNGFPKAQKGTADLVGIFQWFEETLGPYTLGKVVGPVEVDWGVLAYGGIEHHPLWHVSTPALGDAAVHAHETAHGWFGTGVRLECWEDLVLSEGTADYLAARAIAVVVGQEAADKLWKRYTTELKTLIQVNLNAVAWPSETCNQIDVLEDLFSQIPYKKGARFYRAVAAEIGAESLDEVLGMFYTMHHNQAARMQDLLDLIASETGFDPEPLAGVWLRTLELPEGWDQ